MNPYLQEFKDSGAFLEGHFILSSGLHSAHYIQCALALREPKRGERLAKALVNKLLSATKEAFDFVISPAMGGLIIGHDVARCLDLPFIFVERVENIFTLKRGFWISKNARCLIVEDVITTGKSTRETIDVVQKNGGHVQAVCALINRNGQKNVFDIPFCALLECEFETYQPNNLPPELLKIPPIKPGSRGSSPSFGA